MEHESLQDINVDYIEKWIQRCHEYKDLCIVV